MIYGETVDAVNVDVDNSQASVYYVSSSGSFTGGNVTNPQGDGVIVENDGTKSSSGSRLKIQPYDRMEAGGSKAAVTFVLHNSEIIGAGAADSWGAYAWATGQIDLTITNCNIRDWTYGAVAYDDGGGVTSAINGNYFSGCDDALYSNAVNLQDGSANWYTTIIQSEIIDLIDGNFDYTPWLGAGTDYLPGTTGFQSDYSILFVDDASSQSGTDGRIQEGVIRGSGNIWVHEGVYYESVNFGGKAVTVKSMFDQDDDDSHIVNTVIDADVAVLGVDNASAVVFDSGEGSSSVLKGFTIRNGTGTKNPDDLNRLTGGAVYCNGSSPTISYCVMYDNSAVRGGAVACVDANPNLINCTLANNDGANGSGISCYQSSPVIENTIVAYNTGTPGEAVYCLDGTSDPSLSCCDVYGNGGGDYTGCITDQAGVDDNFNADPLFCGLGSNDYYVADISQCADGNAFCGTQIGVFGVNCTDVYLCGDVNGDGLVDITDAVFLINFVFILGSPAPDPMESGNVNCDSVVDISDAVYLINYVFEPGWPAPCDCK